MELPQDNGMLAEAKQKQPPKRPLDPGNEKTIYALGLASLIALGPLTGIAAWIWGESDLRKIDYGKIVRSARTNTYRGKMLGTIGTFISPLSIYLLLTLFPGLLGVFSLQTAEAERQAIVSDINSLAAAAYEYYSRPAEKGGGGGAYINYRIPSGRTVESSLHRTISIARNENATYTAMATQYWITFKAVSMQSTDNSVTVTFGRDGRPSGRWTYTGEYQQ